MRLFILGNGFDRAHNLPTGYCQFRAWLIKNYNINIDEEIQLPSYKTNFKRIEDYVDAEFAGFFVRLLDDVDLTSERVDICQNKACMFFKYCADRYRDKWRSFEEDLAKLRWELSLNGVEKIYDDEGDLDFSQTSNCLSLKAQDCGQSNHILRKFFKEWISFINSIIKRNSNGAVKPFFKNVFDINDKYLTFNYTDTLETLYNIENVCHIHGDISKWEEPVFGHCDPGYPEKKFKEYEYNAYEIFQRIYESYIKDTQKQIKRHQKFFDSIKDVEKIYLYGLSFGDVDLPYFSYIFENCTKVKAVYLNVFNLDEFGEKVATLKSCGVKCKINKW